MALKAQDYAAFQRPTNVPAANQVMMQGLGSVLDGMKFSEQKRRALAMEEAEINRLAEVNRSALENEEQSRNNEVTRQAEKLRQVRITAIKESHDLLAGGFNDEAKARLSLAGMELGELTAEKLERLAEEEATKIMAEAKKKDEAEAEELELELAAVETEAALEKDRKKTEKLAAESEDAGLAAAYESRPQAGTTAKDLSGGRGADDAASLDRWLTTAGRQGAADARAGFDVTGPTTAFGMGSQSVPMPPPAPMMMAPPGGLPPMPPPGPQSQQAQQAPRPQVPGPYWEGSNAPVQQHVVPQQRPQVPQQMTPPGMLPIQMDPLERNRVLLAKKITQGTANMQAYFTKMKAGLVPEEQKVMDAMIETMPELVALEGGNTDVLMEKIAQGIHTKPIFDRIMKREGHENRLKEARILAKAKGSKTDNNNWEKGHKMVSARMDKSKHQEMKRSYDVVQLAYEGFSVPYGAPGYLAAQSAALKALAGERDAKITDQDMKDLMKNKSFAQSITDIFTTKTFGGLGEEERLSYLGYLAGSIERRKKDFGDLRKQALVVVENQRGRGDQYLAGAEGALEEYFSGIEFDMGESWASEEAAIEEEETASQRRGTAGKRKKKPSGKGAGSYGFAL